MDWSTLAMTTRRININGRDDRMTPRRDLPDILFGKSTLAPLPTPEPTPVLTLVSEPSLPPIYVIRDVAGIDVDLIPPGDSP